MNISDLSIGNVYTNNEIMDAFECAFMGGMRRSKKTNTLVLVFDHTKRLYSEPFPDVGINCDNFNCGGDKKELNENNNDNDDDLFILGVIERAAKERKRTKSVVAKLK